MLGPLQLSASGGADSRWDVGLSFGGDYDHWTGVELGPFVTLGAVSLHQPNESDMDLRVAGSWSMLHSESGVSLTLSGGADTGADGQTPYNVYGKVGWDAELVRFGATGFGIDYTWSENVSASGDEGQSVGLAAVQVLESYGIELYSQFRWYTVDNDLGASFEDIFLGTLGSRVRF
jgi:hypothetical protein